MTVFQVVATVLFLGVVGATYGREIVRLVRHSLPAREPAPAHPANPSADLVADMVAVAELRERLRGIGCADGVDACTLLLRVMVEYKYPQE